MTSDFDLLLDNMKKFHWGYQNVTPVSMQSALMKNE